MRRPDPQFPPVFSRADALRAGMTGHQVDHRVRTGRWHQLSRGHYCLSEVWQESRPEDRHVLEVRAAIEVVSFPAFASHASAAALHGLPVPSTGPAWLTRPPPGSTRYADHLTIEVATLPLKDRWSIHGIPVTSLRRTVADCLRHLRPQDALAVLDAALRASPGLGEAVSEVLHDCDTWPYVGSALSVIPLGDGVRESALESWSFWTFHRYDVPMPIPQVDLYDEWGTFLGRADAWWEKYATAGEADGRSKYRIPPGGTPDDVARVLYDEKRRGDAFQAAGAGLIRWGAVDLSRPRIFADRVMRELTAYPRTFRGAAIPHRPT